MKPIKRMKDDNGEWVTAGDRITFSYGTPGRRAHGTVVFNCRKELTVKIDDAMPNRCMLCSLRYYVGAWYKEDNGKEVKKMACKPMPKGGKKGGGKCK